MAWRVYDFSSSSPWFIDESILSQTGMITHSRIDADAGKRDPILIWLLHYTGGFRFQLFALVVGYQRVDQRLKLAVHDLLQLVNGEADTVVGDAVLGEIVSPNFFAAVARADHRLALLGQRVLLLLHLHFVQSRAQHAHPFLAVLDLRLLVLAADHRVGWNMSNAHCRISRVYRLPTGPGGAERVNAQIFGFDLDVHILGLGQHRNRHRGSVYASLLLVGRHTLHPMHAALVLHAREDPLAFHDGDHFLQPAH